MQNISNGTGSASTGLKSMAAGLETAKDDSKEQGDENSLLESLLVGLPDEFPDMSFNAIGILYIIYMLPSHG